MPHRDITSIKQAKKPLANIQSIQGPQSKGQLFSNSELFNSPKHLPSRNQSSLSLYGRKTILHLSPSSSPLLQFSLDFSLCMCQNCSIFITIFQQPFSPLQPLVRSSGREASSLAGFRRRLGQSERFPFLCSCSKLFLQVPQNLVIPFPFRISK